jgi:hypothetical protein
MTPLRVLAYRGVFTDLSKIRMPARGDTATLAFPERGTWIFTGETWRRMKMENEPEPESPAAAALRRLRTPLRLTVSHGKGHSEKTLSEILNPERGHYATGPGGSSWVYDGVAWRRMKKGKRT